MTKTQLRQLMNAQKTNELEFKGHCHDCKKPLSVLAIIGPEGELQVSGGALYQVGDDTVYGKCDSCFKKDRVLRNYSSCEVYTRVVGYMRPINQMNPGKQAEVYKRSMFNVPGTG